MGVWGFGGLGFKDYLWVCLGRDTPANGFKVYFGLHLPTVLWAVHHYWRGHTAKFWRGRLSLTCNLAANVEKQKETQIVRRLVLGGSERLLWGFAGQTTCHFVANVERESQIVRRLGFGGGFEPQGGWGGAKVFFGALQGKDMQFRCECGKE